METQCQSKQLLVNFLMINFLMGAASGIMQLVVPLYVLALNATVAQLGLVIGIGSVGRLFIILPSGFLIDRYGTRKLFIYGTGLNLISVLWLSQVVSPYSLMLIMILQGMTQSVSFMSLQASFLKQLPTLNVSQAGWQKSAVLLGFHLLGPILGAYLIQSVRFTGTFLMISVILGLSIGLSLCRKQEEVARLGGRTLDLPLGLFVQLKEMLTDRLLLQLMLVEVLGAGFFAVFRTFVVPVMVDTLHFSVQTTSWLIISQGAASTVMVLGGGRLLNMFSLNRIFGGGSFLIILGASLMAKATSVSTFWVGAVLFGCGTGLLALTNFVRMSMAKGEAGKIAAMLSLSTAIGSIAGPVLGGFIGNTLTVQAAFWTPALVLGLGGVIFAVVKKRQGVRN